VKSAAPRTGCSGFTLIEVVIALFVIALGIGALLTTLTSSAESVGHLRDKSFAEWVALNRISETRLATAKPGVGVLEGDIDYAGSKWHWRQTIADQGMAGMLRIDVAVARAADAAAASTGADGADVRFPALATAYGFYGTAVAPASGIDPDWSPAAAGGTGGTGGTGGSGGSGSTP
jgi:general secretion pathway protein I